VQALVAGQVMMTIVDPPPATGALKAGTLRGIAVTSAKRSPLAADVPAIAEELPGYELIAWFALVAPAGTPAPVISRLHDTTVKALAKPEVKARFDALGTDVGPMSPDELAAFIRSEIDKWAKMAKAAGIQPE
jgi:tripartite-type tricarboxylate transporter receptor subunit TctC